MVFAILVSLVLEVGALETVRVTANVTNVRCGDGVKFTWPDIADKEPCEADAEGIYSSVVMRVEKIVEDRTIEVEQTLTPITDFELVQCNLGVFEWKAPSKLPQGWSEAGDRPELTTFQFRVVFFLSTLQGIIFTPVTLRFSGCPPLSGEDCFIGPWESTPCQTGGIRNPRDAACDERGVLRQTANVERINRNDGVECPGKAKDDNEFIRERILQCDGVINDPVGCRGASCTPGSDNCACRATAPRCDGGLECKSGQCTEPSLSLGCADCPCRSVSPACDNGIRCNNGQCLNVDARRGRFGYECKPDGKCNEELLVCTSANICLFPATSGNSIERCPLATRGCACGDSLSCNGQSLECRLGKCVLKRSETNVVTGVPVEPPST